MPTQNVNEQTIEERLATVEHILARIVQRLDTQQPADGWLTQFRGCMADEPGFADFVRYGRDFRQSDRASDHDESQP